MIEQTVLIVEDDENIRELYFYALQTAGLNPIKAATGTEGVALALKEHPKVIMMDIMLPDIDGHEAVRRIRADEWGKDARVIYLTNKSEPEDIVKAVEQGSDDYIVKAHTDIKDIVNRVRLAMHA